MNADHVFKHSNGEIVQCMVRNAHGLYLHEGSGRDCLFLTGAWDYQRIGADRLDVYTYCEVPKGRK